MDWEKPSCELAKEGCKSEATILLIPSRYPLKIESLFKLACKSCWAKSENDYWISLEIRDFGKKKE